MESFLRSLAVSFGAAALSVLLAAILALATFGRRTLSAGFQSGLASSFLLLPSYVVAGAWSAGFGSMGWWTLSQVTAAKAPLVGIASVIWIHAMAATPVAYWLLSLGLRRVRALPNQLARTEGGMVSQFTRGIWPSWSSWLVGSFLLIAAWISGDMVVSNLFQVRTLVEQCYLNMVSDQATWSNTLAACSMSLILGLLGLVVIRIAWDRDKPARYNGALNEIAWGPDWLGSICGWSVVMLVIGVPIVNLTIRAGWIPKETSLGTVERSWDLLFVLKNIVKAPRDFYQEFQWAISLACWSALLACSIAAFIVVVVFSKFKVSSIAIRNEMDSQSGVMKSLLFAIFVGCFALPGPVVSGLVIQLFQLPIFGLRWLNDHTLAAPMICLQFRLVPLAILAFAIFERQWQEQVGDLWRMDADKLFTIRIGIIFRALWKSTLAVALVLTAVAFGDLSSYLQCLPPGVTPISMRIFDLLHYGVRASEAGLLIFLVVLGSILGFGVCYTSTGNAVSKDSQ